MHLRPKRKKKTGKPGALEEFRWVSHAPGEQNSCAVIGQDHGELLSALPHFMLYQGLYQTLF